MATTASAPTKPRRFGLAKLAKYTGASVAGVIIGQSTLYLFSAVLDWSPGWANLMAASLGAVPNYTINRYWTWNKRGKNHLWREVMPFWLLTLAGLGMSTWMVILASNQWPDSQLAIQVANLAGYGSVWFVKLLVLEHLLFTHDEAATTD